MKTKKLNVFFWGMIVCCSILFTPTVYGQDDVEYCQMNGLEAIVPFGYYTNSQFSNGTFNTSFRKEASDPASMLIMTVVDTESEITENDLSSVLELFRYEFVNAGIEMGAFSQYTFRNKKAYKAEGSTSLLNTKVRLVIKLFSVESYLVQVLEYYGKDYSDDYVFIEESLRVSDKAKLRGMQTISNEKYTFQYDADKINAVTSKTDAETSFTFSYKDSGEDASFFELTMSSNNSELTYSFADRWFNLMQSRVLNNYGIVKLQPMEESVFLGQPGYVRTGYAIMPLTKNRVMMTIKLCRVDGRIVWSATQQALDSQATTKKLFDSVEASFKLKP